jgi:hypothetical protein
VVLALNEKPLNRTRSLLPTFAEVNTAQSRSIGQGAVQGRMSELSDFTSWLNPARKLLKSAVSGRSDDLECL